MERTARDVLRHFAGVGPSAALEPLGNHGGFSGAWLWRGATPVGSCCLRAWPPGDPGPDRLRWIHEQMLVSRRCGLRFIPAVLVTHTGTTLVECAGRLWDLTTWMPGKADFHVHPHPARLAAACTALARLHLAWQPSATSAPCPALQRRLARAAEWLNLVHSGWQPQFESLDPVSPWAKRAWILLSRHLGNVLQRLTGWKQEALPVQPCLCDVWHDHVLFEGDEVTGIVDFGALKMDHVAVDLARLLGSFVGDDAALWAAGLQAYRQVRPLPEKEERLAHLLDETGTFLALGSWLRWLYVEGKPLPDRNAVARRLADLVQRMEGWREPSSKLPSSKLTNFEL